MNYKIVFQYDNELYEINASCPELLVLKMAAIVPGHSRSKINLLSLESPINNKYILLYNDKNKEELKREYDSFDRALEEFCSLNDSAKLITSQPIQTHQPAPSSKLF